MTFEVMTSGLFALLLVAAATTDVRVRRIPNAICAGLVALGMTSHVLLGGVDGFLSGAAGLLIGFLLLLPFYAKGRMGAGDVKLLAACGCVLGPAGIVNATCLALLVGGLLGLLVLVIRKSALLYPRLYALIPQAQVSSGLKVELPYGLAIAVGALLALQFSIIDLSTIW